jgi:hypothetical protein
VSTLEKRFIAKVAAMESGICWLWTGSRYPTGYGQLWNGERPEQAHRISYRLRHGAIPDGCEIDHLCRNRGCVNPEHLRAVPHRENMRVSDTIMGRNAAKLFCMRGHPLSGQNLYTYAKTGARHCRACLAAYARERRRAAKSFL